MCSNILAKPTYGAYVSQLVRLSRICDTFSTFITRHQLLTERLIKQGFWYRERLIKQGFKRFAKGHAVLFNKYGVSIRTHIQQGICLPLEFRQDLVKSVTSRCRGLCACSAHHHVH